MSSKPASVFDAVSAIGAALAGLSPEDQQKAIDGVSVLLSLKSPIGKQDSHASASHAQHDKGVASAGSTKLLSIVEFIKQKVPATNPQRIATFAAYRQQIENKENFSRDDLFAYFGKAKLPAPSKSHYGRDYTGAVSQGWIHDDGASSYLTQTGEEVVAAGFGGKGQPRGSAVAKKGTSGKKEGKTSA